jgi:hypothetical protein
MNRHRYPKSEWHGLYKFARRVAGAQVVAKIEPDDACRDTIATAMAFFEEFAFVVNTKAAEPTIVRRLLRDDYLRLVPGLFIEDSRSQTHRPR